jgi:RNA polymerase primary sigma factor
MNSLTLNRKITNKDSDVLNLYLGEIRKYSVLGNDEELALTIEARKGNIEAIDKLVKANLRFVVSVAKQYTGLGLPLADLINEGNIGLLKSIEKFDETRGIKFISYSVWWIRSSILNAINEYSSIVKTPSTKAGSLVKTRKLLNLFIQQYEREPSLEDVVIYGNLTHDEIGFLLKMYFQDIPLEENDNEEDENYSLLNLLQQNLFSSETEIMNKKEYLEYIKFTLGKILNEKELQTIWALYGFESICNFQTYESVASNLNITKQRVEQLNKIALNKINRASRVKRNLVSALKNNTSYN